uniref:Reverse transcriptase domain-containing protein n=1 Tax=Strigamia maritima TaxID=126957 RepID=T1IK93_STRMM
MKPSSFEREFFADLEYLNIFLNQNRKICACCNGTSSQFHQKETFSLHDREDRVCTTALNLIVMRKPHNSNSCMIDIKIVEPIRSLPVITSPARNCKWRRRILENSKWWYRLMDSRIDIMMIEICPIQCKRFYEPMVICYCISPLGVTTCSYKAKMADHRSQTWTEQKDILHLKGSLNTGDASLPSNYRGITLLNGIYKIIMAMMAKRISSWLEENHKIKESQPGFRRGYKIVKRSGLQDFVSIECLFDSLILSVVGYGVEIWGLRLQEVVERVQRKVFKMLSCLDRLYMASRNGSSAPRVVDYKKDLLLYTAYSSDGRSLLAATLFKGGLVGWRY